MKFELLNTSIGIIDVSYYESLDSICESMKVDNKKYNIFIEEFTNRYNRKVKKLCIEFKTIEEIIDFYKDYGEIIITDTYSGIDNLKAIEIYDDWRE